MPGEVAQPDFDSVEAEPEDLPAAGRRWSLRRLAMVAGIVLIAAAAAAYGAYALGYLDVEGNAEAPPVYFELPEMTINLSTVDERPQYLKIRAALEMRDNSIRDAITPVLPRVLDAFQVYLRELRPSDLHGSAGIYRLKEELVRRVNIAIHPAEIDAVVFNEVIVQ